VEPPSAGAWRCSRHLADPRAAPTGRRAPSAPAHLNLERYPRYLLGMRHDNTGDPTGVRLMAVCPSAGERLSGVTSLDIRKNPAPGPSAPGPPRAHPTRVTPNDGRATARTGTSCDSTGTEGSNSSSYSRASVSTIPPTLASALSYEPAPRPSR
jgi:hypothetical protein